MVVTQVAYEVEGWGVGELWFEGPRVVWHDLPFPRATAETGDGGELVERLRAYFAGRPDSFDDIDLDLEYETPFLERCAQELRAVPRGTGASLGDSKKTSARSHDAAASACPGASESKPL